jgi:hypothetical protein
MRQLVILFTGKPRTLIRRIVHPIDGIIPECKGTPTIKAVLEWMAKQPYGEPIKIAQHKEPEEIISPEERARRVQMLRGCAQQIRDAVKAKCVGRPYEAHPTKVSSRRLLDGLEYLEACKPREANPDD